MGRVLFKEVVRQSLYKEGEVFAQPLADAQAIFIHRNRPIRMRRGRTASEADFAAMQLAHVSGWTWRSTGGAPKPQCF